KELSRDKFMQSLLSLKEQRVTESCFQPQWLTCPVEASAEE
ncbi:MAG: leucyl/phenylalanyl-tRNA--protein transferase, partial [Vibrionaceae bacterium]